MTTGMIWQGDKHRTAAENAEIALAYYRNKYGPNATRCIVHPTVAALLPRRIGVVVIESAKTVLPGTFWIGED